MHIGSFCEVFDQSALAQRAIERLGVTYSELTDGTWSIAVFTSTAGS